VAEKLGSNTKEMTPLLHDLVGPDRSVAGQLPSFQTKVPDETAAKSLKVSSAAPPANIPNKKANKARYRKQKRVNTKTNHDEDQSFVATARQINNASPNYQKVDAVRADYAEVCDLRSQDLQRFILNDKHHQHPTALFGSEVNTLNLRLKAQKHYRNNTKRRPLYAALDLGTNNCRLLIAAPTKPGYFRVIDAFSRIVRLGEGLSQTGRLSNEAMERAIEALKICQAKLKLNGIRYKRLIATEACRSAENGENFINRVREETGLDIEVVDRETEARLAVSGCGTLVERETEAIVLFDIGGGSSEIALIDISRKRSPRLAEHITAWTSLPVGVVTLAEKFGGDQVTPAVYYAMKNHVRRLLDKFTDRDKLGNLVHSQHFHLLGTSGTVTTLAGLFLDLDKYDRRRIDGIWMENCDVTRMTERLLSWDINRRIANPCIGQDRADLVLAGCAILDAIREIWPSERLRVADRGLREGILTELMFRHGAWHYRHRRHHHAKATSSSKTIEHS